MFAFTRGRFANDSERDGLIRNHPEVHDSGVKGVHTGLPCTGCTSTSAGISCELTATHAAK